MDVSLNKHMVVLNNVNLATQIAGANASRVQLTVYPSTQQPGIFWEWGRPECCSAWFP
jgi:hypothetical protein